MSDGRWVRKIIAAVAVGNLIVLSIFFLIPRMQFLLAHVGLASSRIMETIGSRDMPNQLSKTYEVVRRIQELTPASATLFMPPGDRVNGSFRSAAIQILYPRKIIFGDDENFTKELKAGKKLKMSYFVYSPQWKLEYCRGETRVELTKFGFGMCELDE